MIYRTKHKSNFTVVDNGYLKDENLSWKAKGLFTYILSCNDSWQFYLYELSKHAVDGKASTNKALKELLDNGYLKRSSRYEHKNNNKEKRFNGYNYDVFESNKNIHDRISDAAMLSRNTRGRIAEVENQLLINTKPINTEPLNTKINNIKPKRENLSYSSDSDYSSGLTGFINSFDNRDYIENNNDIANTEDSTNTLNSDNPFNSSPLYTVGSSCSSNNEKPRGENVESERTPEPSFGRGNPDDENQFESDGMEFDIPDGYDIEELEVGEKELEEMDESEEPGTGSYTVRDVEKIKENPLIFKDYELEHFSAEQLSAIYDVLENEIMDYDLFSNSKMRFQDIDTLRIMKNDIYRYVKGVL